MSTDSVIRISPIQFVHVLNLNNNVTRLECGPTSLVLQTNERLVTGPVPLVIVPPGHYCVVIDPIKNYRHGQLCELKMGEIEIRFHKAPFALYPGERLEGMANDKTPETTYKKAFRPLPTIALNHGLKLRAKFEHVVNGVKRLAGDIWQLEGPCTYHPTPQVEVLEEVKPVIILTGQALRLCALKDCVDKHGNVRVTGEEWIVKRPGAYLPGTYEKVRGVEEAVILTEDMALHLRATQSTKDSLKHSRLAGDEWLLTNDDTEIFFPDIGVEVIGKIRKTILSKGQYCVVMDPVNQKGHPQLGQRELRKGLYSFFLHPGEWLLEGIQNAHVLTENEAVVVKALHSFIEETPSGTTKDAPSGKTKEAPPSPTKQALLGKTKEAPPSPTKPALLGTTKEAASGKIKDAVSVTTKEAASGKTKDAVSGTTKEAASGKNKDAVSGTTKETASGKTKETPSDMSKETPSVTLKDTYSGVTKVERKPGDRWMIRGPCVYIPPIQVNIINKRTKIPLSVNEGVYVRDVQSGAVRAVNGPQSYMLTEFEELWEKPLSDLEENLLKQGGGLGSEDIRKVAYFEQSIDPEILQGRSKSRVIRYRCPGNTAVQVYNYQKKTSRVVFGPELVILGPHENFNVLSLSAGKPKKPDALKSICLMLGPDFITDIIEVETSDHARLRLQIAFNNQFEYTKGDQKSEFAIFAIPDFIGFACRQIASRIRSSVAHTLFDEFHRHSSKIIQTAVFGTSATPVLRFPHNNMVITSIDIQSIEPVDLNMRDSLMKSVQMAIEIATNSLEAAATHEAKRMEQAARGKLDQQKLANEMEAEGLRITLCEIRAVTAAVESTGQATAEAEAEAEKTRIECTSEIEVAKLKAKADEIEHYTKLEVQGIRRSSELSYQSRLNTLQVEKQRRMTAIEVGKFRDVVKSLGANTISAIATSGPETQVTMLKALGMESVLITDGNSPINLFNMGQGLIGKMH